MSTKKISLIGLAVWAAIGNIYIYTNVLFYYVVLVIISQKSQIKNGPPPKLPMCNAGVCSTLNKRIVWFRLWTICDIMGKRIDSWYKMNPPNKP